MTHIIGISDASIEELIDQGIRKELDLLRFYEKATPLAEYDVHHLFEQLLEGSRTRMNLLEESKRDLAMLRTLTEPMAD